jgi:hypothetical protein
VKRSEVLIGIGRPGKAEVCAAIRRREMVYCAVIPRGRSLLRWTTKARRPGGFLPRLLQARQSVGLPRPAPGKLWFTTDFLSRTPALLTSAQFR